MEGGTLRRLALMAGGSGPPAVLADRADGAVVRSGRVVAKAHDPHTDVEGLVRRLAIAAHPLLRDVLLPPLPFDDLPPVPTTGSAHPARAGGLLGALPDGRPVSRWPYGRPVSPDAPEAAPWSAAGRLLAGLHAVPVAALPVAPPPMRGPAKAARAVRRMRACGADPRHVRLVERVWAGLPARARNADAHNAAQDGTPAAHNGTGRAGPVVALCHGDLHLGQLVRPPSRAERWLLIDVDDLGVGDPAWDLARPAAWYAAGLLPTEDWQRFLGAYLDAGGCAVPPGTDPWAVLDVPARALTAQTAASGLVRAAAEGRPPDEVELVLLDTCLRIAGPGGPAQA